MAMTETLRHSLLSHAFRNSAYSQPSAVYVALFAAGDVEITKTGFPRKAVTFGAPSAGVIANSAIVEWTGDDRPDEGSTATAFKIMDAATGGNVMAAEDLTVSKVIETGDIVRFAIGDLTVELTAS